MKSKYKLPSTMQDITKDKIEPFIINVTRDALRPISTRDGTEIKAMLLA